MTEPTSVVITIPGVTGVSDLTPDTVDRWTSTALATRAVRYILKDLKDLSDCFEPLLKKRKKLEQDLEKIRKDARTRGYLMVGGQLGTCISLFLPFVKKNFKNNTKKFTGMSLYLFIIFAVGLLIALSLWHLLQQWDHCEERLKKLMAETQKRLQRYGMVLNTSSWEEEVKKLPVAVEGVPAENEEAKSARMSLDDELVVIKVRELCASMDFGWMGKKLVWIVMAVASFILVSIAVTATISRIT